MSKIELGKTYMDTISGFTGIATARAEYLHDTDFVRRSSRELVDGEAKSEWFSVGRLAEAETV